MSESNKHGNLFIISAPSGAGKTSLVKALIELVPSLYVSISHTTRPRRAYEKDGIDYHFVDKAGFMSLVATGQFLEYAEVFDNYYGTSRAWVEQQLSNGKDIVLEIDWQGARQVRKQMPDSVNIFILPPSYQTLSSRLVDRGDDDDIIERRMRGARDEIAHYREYDFLVINDDFATALGDLKTIIQAMKHGYTQQKDWYDGFVSRLLNDHEN
jgi:guanylate kinase